MIFGSPVNMVHARAMVCAIYDTLKNHIAKKMGNFPIFFFKISKYILFV